MDRSNKVSPQSDADTRNRREARDSKPVREWTAEERREAFVEARRVERQKAEAGVLDEWKLCETCHEDRHEQGLRWCKHCIERMRQYAD